MKHLYDFQKATYRRIEHFMMTSCDIFIDKIIEIIETNVTYI